MSPIKEIQGLEMPPEVQVKMQKAPSALIAELDVQDLRYVPICAKGYWLVKRLLDIVFAIAGMAVLLLPMVLIGTMIFLDDPGPVIFTQYRIGRNGKRFRFYKFRTMKSDAPKYMATAEMEEPSRYITRLGKFLRKTSLDELPQLLNVMKGDMSLIGPRPLIADEYEIHTMRMRFGVYQLRPGVTGLAQINGRDTVPPAEKVRWDVQYLKEFSFMADLRIMLTTIPKVFGGSNVVEGKNNKNES